ncbi:methyl-accepting chemotaxis protein [Paraburkholderia sp. MPAMCS5]|uniref:methyl-accepting chemotaxis protein n=1 Tax=Paraburkholderia sp. MPAMCS5 TaxID=3112563 RepID=UPI002E16FFF7|nr:methyl-accepting chemotaxis protein [Paraburkholderia sp. MPAMCS5]
MNLSALRIGPRLAVGFGAVLIFTAIAIATGFAGLKAERESSDRAISHVYPQAAAANRAAFLVEDNARLVRNLILKTEQNEIAADKAVFDKNSSSTADLLDRLKTLADSDEARTRLGKLVAARADYGRYTDAVIELAMQGKKPEATQALYGPDYKLQGVYLSALADFVSYTESQMQQADSRVTSVYESSLVWLFASGVFALLAGSGFAWLVTRSIVKPLRDAVRVSEAVGAGDLTCVIDAQAHDEPGQVMSALKGMNANLARIVGSVRVGSDHLVTTSREIASGNADLSARTEEQAASLEETASSMTQLTQTVRQNSDNARQANSLAIRATEKTDSGNEAVQDMVRSIGRVSESSEQISQITGTIEGIAFQTNILALNAAVEAARAGDQGRGFAVVASEVRSLAQRSAAAAKEINELIASSVSLIQDSAKQATEVGETMSDLKQSIKQVSDIVGEIAAASDEQSRGIDQVHQAVSQMDEVTQQNAALVEQAAAAAQSLETQALSLKEAVSVFKLTDQASSMPAAIRPQGNARGEPKKSAAVAAAKLRAITPTDRAPARAGAALSVPSPSPSRVAAPAVAADETWETF